MISITLDKKVKYTAYPIHPSLRGEYGDQVKVRYLEQAFVKNNVLNEMFYR
jgi:hypothetical protein